MKKLLLLFVGLSALTLTGCKDKEAAQPDSLAGTTWVYEDEDVDLVSTAVLSFDATHFTLDVESIEQGEKSHDTMTGTYSYLNPVVTLYPPFGGEPPMSGIVSGDIITFKDEDNDTIVFNRL